MIAQTIANYLGVFQSTLPIRGATAKVTEFTLNLKTKFMTFGTKTNIRNKNKLLNFAIICFSYLIK